VSDQLQLESITALTFPAPRWLAEFWQMGWERRGVKTKLVKRGRLWVVQER
jgi:hypothetical protein